MRGALERSTSLANGKWTEALPVCYSAYDRMEYGIHGKISYTKAVKHMNVVFRPPSCQPSAGAVFDGDAKKNTVMPYGEEHHVYMACERPSP